MGFIRVGVDLNATDESGRTGRPASCAISLPPSTPSPILIYPRHIDHLHLALHFAAAYGRLEAVQTLLTAGASINVLDSRGNTPLHVAR